MNQHLRNLAAFVCLVALATAANADEKKEGKWIQLFNGKDLTGWTPKINGYELGENFGNTFRVEDGYLSVGYENYDKFANKFGHIFYKDHFSHYRLRVEYRFTGKQATEGPGWAFRNSGLMIHGQSAKSMAKDQRFPVSIEVQLLGGREKGERTNANLCTPGTHVEMGGKLVKRHCISSKSKTCRGDEWYTVEVEVRGNEVIKHFVDGKEVMSYNKPQLDENDADAKKLLAAGAKKLITGGSISLQSESHPIQFRKVELMKLDDK